VSEPNLAHNSRSIADGAIETEEAGNALRPSLPTDSWEQEHTALLAELMQARSLVHSQLERIRHLEQALDQSLTSLEELRLQIIDQQLLENQLATTEEISNIQQQAIVRLKRQLVEQQQHFDRQFSDFQGREQQLRSLLESLETLTQSQQAELEQLRQQLSTDRSELQTYQGRLEKQLADLQATFNTQQQRVIELEAQSFSARLLAGSLEVRLNQAQERIQELLNHIDERQVAIDQLETELRQAHTALQEQQVVVDHLMQPSPGGASQRPLTVVPMAMDTDSPPPPSQAMVRHAFQELGQERDRQQARISDLERQTAEMQEQILRQAKQASEYETAVQHWKDRYVNNHYQLLQVKNLLEAVPNLTPELLELLNSLQAMPPEAPEPVSPALLDTPVETDSKIDLPEFLIRRRSYKSRRSS